MANHINKPTTTSSTNVNKNIGSHSNKNINKTNSSSPGEWKTQQKQKRIHSDSSISDNPTSPKAQQINVKIYFPQQIDLKCSLKILIQTKTWTTILPNRSADYSGHNQTTSSYIRQRSWRLLRTIHGLNRAYWCR